MSRLSEAESRREAYRDVFAVCLEIGSVLFVVPYRSGFACPVQLNPGDQSYFIAMA